MFFLVYIVDTQKAYDKVIWWVLHKRNVHQCYIDIIKDMNEGTVTSDRSVDRISSKIFSYKRITPSFDIEYVPVYFGYRRINKKMAR